MSARKTGTPAADSCSAISWRVLVLPVPVAPATRPCRLSADERDPDQGVRMGGAIDDHRAELQGGAGEGIARLDRVELGRRGVRRRAWCHATQRIAAVALDCRS